MGLFKKKKEETEEAIPKLPELPKLPKSELPVLPSEYLPDVPAGLPQIETQPVPKEIQTLPTLPDLPDSKNEKNFNQNMIKNEIEKPERLPGFQKSNFPNPKINFKPKRTLELSPPIIRTPKLTKKAEPIFVRLDKFQTTIEIFEEIKTKIQEIDNFLKKTKEIKTKEEQELSEWEREIQIIKSRIDLIDKNIFNKLD